MTARKTLPLLAAAGVVLPQLVSAQDAGIALLYGQAPFETGGGPVKSRPLVINAQTWDNPGDAYDYDYDAADDFVVPAGELWSIESVYIDSRLAEVDDESAEIVPLVNLSIWTDDPTAGRPLAPVVDDAGFTCTYTELVPIVDKPDVGGSPQENLTITLPTACALPPGTYWLVATALSDTNQALFMWAQTNVVTGSPTHIRSLLGWLSFADPVNCADEFEPSHECDFYSSFGPNDDQPRDLAYQLFGQQTPYTAPDGGVGEADAGPGGGGDAGLSDGGVGELDGGSADDGGTGGLDASIGVDSGAPDGDDEDGDDEDGDDEDGDDEDGDDEDGDDEDGDDEDGDDEDGSLGDGDDGDGPDGGKPGKPGKGGGGGCSVSAEPAGHSSLGMLGLGALASLILRRRRRTPA